MPQKKSSSAPEKEEILAELKSKVEFLIGKSFDYSLKEVAGNINMRDSNLRNYLNNNKRVTREKLLGMLADLNKYYARDLRKWKPRSPRSFSHNQSPSSEVGSAPPFIPEGIHLQALTEMLFEYLSRSMGIPVAELRLELEKKVAEIEKRSS